MNFTKENRKCSMNNSNCLSILNNAKLMLSSLLNQCLFVSAQLPMRIYCNIYIHIYKNTYNTYVNIISPNHAKSAFLLSKQWQ